MTQTLSRATIIVLFCLLGACATDPESADAPILDGTAWVLASLPGKTMILGEATPTAQFKDGLVQGSDGCNRYFAPFTQTGPALTIGEHGGMSMMACPPAVTEQARVFMDALTSTRSFLVADGRLELLGAGGAVLATLAEQSIQLADTRWQVTGFNNGRQAVVSPLIGTDLTLEFSGDGRISGSAGCNNYSGVFEATGTGLALRSIAATRALCTEPAEVMPQEQAFLESLQTAATASFEGDRLDLRTADGALAATLSRKP